MTIELGLLATFGAMIFWALGDFFIQRNVREIGDLEALAFIGIFGALGLLPFVIQDLPTVFSQSNLLILLVLSIVTFIAALFNFEALKKGKLSVVDVILELELPIAVVLGMLFFNERLVASQFFIIGLIFVGIVLVSWKKSEEKENEKRLEKGFILALIAGVLMGLVDFLTAASAKQISPIMAVWGPWVMLGLLSLIPIIRRGEGKKFVKNAWQYRWIVLSMAFFDTIAWYFYAVATSTNDISITTAITESYPALAMLLGVFFNKERMGKYQYMGAALAIASSCLLALTVR